MRELKYKINEQILELLKKNCEGDKKLEKILTQFLLEEAAHNKVWQWKETYIREIEKCLED